MAQGGARDAVVELAFAPWALISDGRLEEGLPFSMTRGHGGVCRVVKQPPSPTSSPCCGRCSA